MPDAPAPRTDFLAGLDDTIAATATPPGRGAVALVRVSGPRASEVVGRVASPWPLPPRAPTLCALRAPDSGELLDRAVVTRFAAPHSYTGDDVVELSTHGGALIPARVLGALLAAGARQALPGEFTRRAVLAGKLDLLQAEAVADLVDARSTAAHRSALAQLDGGLSRRVQSLREALLDLEALIAYDIDFPEEDDGPVGPARIAAAAARAHALLDALLATAPAGTLVRDGALVVIAGAPNVGKSSLFNALLGVPRAIVTEVPGTTRDAVEAVLDTGRWPLRLVDTAGLRATSDVVERLGIEVSERYLADAHLVLVCAESPEEMCLTLRRVRDRTPAPLVAVWTKRDLHPAERSAPDRPSSGSGCAGAGGADTAAEVPVSAESGAGLGALVQALESLLADRYGAPPADTPLLTRARHRQALERARDELTSFRQAWEGRERLPAPVAAVHLRTAVGALEELIGAVDLDQVLDRVFGSFCVGK